MNPRVGAFVLVLVISAIPQGTTGLSSSQHYFLSPPNLTWHEAETYCKDNDACYLKVGNNFERGSRFKCRSGTATGTNELIYQKATYWHNAYGKSYSAWEKLDGLEKPNGFSSKGCAFLKCDMADPFMSLHIGLCGNVTSYDRSTIMIDVGTTSQHTTTVVATSGVGTLAQNTPGSVVNGSCDICCVKDKNSRQLDHEELQRAKQELKFQLAVNKTNLSANRRKVISVYDSRPSSVAVGGVAIAFLTVVLGIIVVQDMVKLIKFMLKPALKRQGKTHTRRNIGICRRERDNRE